MRCAESLFVVSYGKFLNQKYSNFIDVYIKKPKTKKTSYLHKTDTSKEEYLCTSTETMRSRRMTIGNTGFSLGVLLKLAPLLEVLQFLETLYLSDGEKRRIISGHTFSLKRNVNSECCCVVKLVSMLM